MANNRNPNHTINQKGNVFAPVVENPRFTNNIVSPLFHSILPLLSPVVRQAHCVQDDQAYIGHIAGIPKKTLELACCPPGSRSSLATDSGLPWDKDTPVLGTTGSHYWQLKAERGGGVRKWWHAPKTKTKWWIFVPDPHLGGEGIQKA